MAIYWRLREVLDAKGVTPLQLAERLKLAHPAIYRLVRHDTITRITSMQLDRICTALGCSPGDLLQHVPPQPKPKRRPR